MPSPLLIAFTLQFLILAINTLGKQTFNDTLWRLYTLVFSTTSNPDTQDLSKQKREVLRLQRELNATSAQDEFAKWAKLRRQHDKAKEKYEAQAQQSARQTFDRIASALRFLGTQGLNFGCNFYFGKQAMFWLPSGWFPYPVEWVLSFPRAPLGAVSINVWGIACASVIGLLKEGVVGVWGLRSAEGKQGAVKVPAGAGTGVKGEGEGMREKKEL
ncbi:CHD5-like protein-domain-containing protein [Neohortaea acidophila]|uniref:CHD5-like protein-domain-containing protein n=1 Tax=Neohortaea acidophila TaxID=245834 RepID=A0A6A6PL20_9PEZI|nr:CHD5-like protein-domain-containing protein [Neohortaea acidophila]KAF2480183.1 CHD5-like protein-domain-containing protein [Neohortaea acidophila]